MYLGWGLGGGGGNRERGEQKQLVSLVDRSETPLLPTGNNKVPHWPAVSVVFVGPNELQSWLAW